MKALIIAYYYPPPASGGSERPRQMAKYLTRYGHDVAVLTHAYGGNDLSRNGLVRIGDISRNLDRRGIHFLQWLGLRLATEALNRIGIYRTIYTPWKNRACREAETVIRSIRPDLVIASYPPVEDLEIGLQLSSRFGLPLISDFRDGLLFEPIEVKSLERLACLRRHYREIEAAAVKGSAALLCFSPVLADYFATTYGHPRIVTLPNGFDEEEHAATAADPFPAGLIHVVHTGSIGLSQDAVDIEPFCRALEHVAAATGGKRMCLHLLGRLSRAEKKRLRRLVGSGIVRLHGQKSRAEALACQKAADLLFFITPQRRSVAPAKLFEYLGARRPILGLTPPASFAASIVRETETGWIADPGDAQGIEKLIAGLLADPGRLQQVRPNQERIDLYSRQNQMRSLAALIDTILPGGKSK